MNTPAAQQWKPTQAQRSVLMCLADVAEQEGGHITLKNKYHSAAMALVRRGYVEKVDRDLLRPLYIITPAGLTAWKQIRSPSMSEAIKPLGAYLHKMAQEQGYCTRQLGTLFIRVTRDGNDWACELCDETPISPEVAQHWAVEVGAPGGTEFRKEAHGKVWRLEWQENREETAAQRAATVAFYLHGGKP